jgi:hypothetical protein
MGIQSWMIKSWPMVDFFPPEGEDEWPAFWHVSTHERAAAGSARHGETVWMGLVDGQNVGMAWEWTELCDGVLMLCDPNSIVSNLRLGAGMAGHEYTLLNIVMLNRVTHQLPWQRTVREVLAAATKGTLSMPAFASRVPQTGSLARRGQERTVA